VALPLLVVRPGEDSGDDLQFEASLVLRAYPARLPKPSGPPLAGDRAPVLPATLKPVGASRLTDLEGRPRVLFFWATWCGPCKKAVPEVMAFAQSRGLSVLAISDEDDDTVGKFLDGRAGAFFDQVAVDTLRQTFASYGISGTPTILLVDGDGIIRHRQVGYDADKGVTVAGWRWVRPVTGMTEGKSPWGRPSSRGSIRLSQKGPDMRRRMSSLSVGLVLACVLSARVAAAQQPTTEDLKKEIEAVKESLKAIQKDIQEIKALLQSRLGPPPPPQNVVLDLGKNAFKGERTAKLTLVEFSDYQWPFCSRHVRETAPQIDKEYIETGKLKHVFLDFPLESIHKLAFKAAEVADCAGEQGKYWEMHDRLYANQQSLEPWTAHAEAIGLDIAKFQDCLSSGRSADEIRKDMAEAQKAGVTGTPAFFLAYTDPNSSKVKTLTGMKGAQPFGAFKAAIDKLLAEQPTAAK
jgi:protein-disulfide isomerase/thiol-disulfide isomerase/thioredoxin